MRENVMKYAKKVLSVFLAVILMVTATIQWSRFAKASNTGYTEMKFQDWGTSEGSLYGVDIYSLTDKNAIADLDGVAVSGQVNFQNSKDTYFRIGGTAGAKHAGFRFGTWENKFAIWPQAIGGKEAVQYVLNEAEWGAIIGTDFDLRLEFDKNGTTSEWTIQIYINEVLKGSYNCGTTAPGLYLGNVGVTFVEESPAEKTEMEFIQWGVSEGSLYGVNIYSLTDKNAITSLDGVSVSGKVDFHNSKDTYFRIGGTTGAKHAGFRFGTWENKFAIWPQAIGGTEAVQYVMDEAEWGALIGTEFALRLEFSKSKPSAEWTVQIYINDVSKGTYNCGKTTPGLYLGTVGVTFKELHTMEYKEMTFAEWGVSEGSLYGVNIYSLTDLDAVTDLHGVAVSGNVNFKGNEEAYFRIGGYKTDDSDMRHAGFRLGTVNGCLGLWPQAIGGNTANQQVLNAQEWADLINTEFQLRVEFTRKKGTSDWNLEVYINEVSKGSFDCGAATPGLYIANSGVEIAGLGSFLGMEIPDIYNPPTEMAGETLVGNYITDVSTKGKTTVISAADEENGYVSSTDYSAYGFDYVVDYDVERDLKVLQLTDTQTIDSNQSRTENRLHSWEIDKWKPEEMYNNVFRYIIKTVRDAKPDLILLTGDIIYGEFDDDGTSLIALINCMDSLKIPWAPIFGNHENESDMGVAWQCEQLENSTYCLFKRRNEIGGNGNYSIGIAKNGEVQRAIYMMDNNGCANNSIYNGNEVKTTFGFTEKQKEWYKSTAKKVNEIAGETIPSFLAYHAPTVETQKAVVAAGYQLADSTDTYTLGIDVKNVQDGDSGTKGGKTVYTYEEPGLLEIMKSVGTDGAFFGHEHLNNISVAYEGIRWTYGLKTGTYDAHPEEVGGTLITLDSESDLFTIEQIKTATSEIDRLYPSMEYRLPEAPKNPNDAIEEMEYNEVHFADFVNYSGVVEGVDIYGLKRDTKLVSLNGVAISGTVNFGNITDGRISIGGTEEMKHAGFWLFTDGENLRLSPQGIGQQIFDYWVMPKEAWKPLINQDIDLRVTFYQEPSKGQWWIGIYINGQKVGVYNCGAATPGLYLGVFPGVTVKGLEDTVKTKGLDFTLFGYSNNKWRKEMGLD